MHMKFTFSGSCAGLKHARKVYFCLLYHYLLNKIILQFDWINEDFY